MFLEEAAGVSKYRERRRETELRLEDTRENLARVGDIRAELDTQLAHLAAAGRGRREVPGAAGASSRSTTTCSPSRACARRSRRRTAARTRCRRRTVALEAEMARLRESERALEELRSRHYQETDQLQRAAGRALRGQRRGAVARAGDRLPGREPPAHGRAARGARRGGRRGRAAHRRGAAASASAGRRRSTRARAAIAAREARAGAGARRRCPRPRPPPARRPPRCARPRREMSAAEQAQGVEETRESHALKLLSQLEARKNRLKQENMALVFPEPEKLARGRVRARAGSRRTHRRRSKARSARPRRAARARGAAARRAPRALQESTRELAGLEAALAALAGAAGEARHRFEAQGLGRRPTTSSAPSACGRRSTWRRAGTTRWKRRSACA